MRKIIQSLVAATVPMLLWGQIETLEGPDPRTFFHAEILLDSSQHLTLPFEVFMIKRSENTPEGLDIDLYISNGAESLRLQYNGTDSAGYETWNLPYFSGYFKWKKQGRGLSGSWVRPDAGYEFPLTLEVGDLPRFALAACDAEKIPLAPRYDVRIYSDSPDDVDPYVGVFEEDSTGRVTGTIMTNSGDFRYLVGNRAGNMLRLSTFNGIFAYIFEFDIAADGTMEGTYYSGAKTRRKLRATPDSTVKLLDPTAIASWNENRGPLELQVPAYNSDETISIEPGYVHVVQIMGSWCPNCVDESDAFRWMQQRFADQPLRVLAVTFERWESLEQSFPAIDKFVRDVGIPYPIAFGGRATRENIERVFPGLKNFRAYPTTLYVDKKGVVRKVYTGFNGPGTPVYNDWLEDTQRYLIELLNE